MVMMEGEEETNIDRRRRRRRIDLGHRLKYVILFLR